jgi:DNA-directed RNA polymerase
VPSETVQDIYKLVSDEVNMRLKQDFERGTVDSTEVKTNPDTGEILERRILGSTSLARGWLDYGVDRSVTKRSVMTLAYGSKEYGFTDQVRDDIITPAVDEGSTFFPDPQLSARYMAKLIWDSVSNVVVAAVEAMNWLQKAAKLLAKEIRCKKTDEVLKAAMPVYWITTDGFPVWQEYKVSEKKRIDCMFLGTIRLQATVMMTPKVGAKIDARKQESGISPNFVHSQDGSHLRKTVVRGHDHYKITFFALIHDSFGTIAAHAGKLFRAVRETFVETYDQTCILSDFREQFIDQLHETQIKEMPPIPKKGTLDIRGTLASHFAFA